MNPFIVKLFVFLVEALSGVILGIILLGGLAVMWHGEIFYGLMIFFWYNNCGYNFWICSHINRGL